MNVLLFILGSVVGSFLSAYTYRFPRNLDFVWGRSFCPNCKAKISWYDNIPLLSFILLKGRCRNCNKAISRRYPIMEFSTGLAFVSIFSFLNYCTEVVCQWSMVLGSLALPYFLLLVSIMIAIFVIDLEYQIIPDNLVFFLFLTAFVLQLISYSPTFFAGLFTAFGASLFLLALHLLTKGRGMGLGDVKLALPAGLILGWPMGAVWLFVSFVIGGVVGIILILLKKAHFGKQIAFGPFLVVGYLIALFRGERILGFLFPVF